jgi:hypothetical protein
VPQPQHADQRDCPFHPDTGWGNLLCVGTLICLFRMHRVGCSVTTLRSIPFGMTVRILPPNH